MFGDNNLKLAEVYQPHITQTVIIFPYVWKHYPNGNWFINWQYSLNGEWQ